MSSRHGLFTVYYVPGKNLIARRTMNISGKYALRELPLTITRKRI